MEYISGSPVKVLSGNCKDSMYSVSFKRTQRQGLSDWYVIIYDVETAIEILLIH